MDRLLVYRNYGGGGVGSIYKYMPQMSIQFTIEATALTHQPIHLLRISNSLLPIPVCAFMRHD